MEAFRAILAFCEGNSLVTGEFLLQRASNADLMFLWCGFAQASNETIECQVI